MSKQKKLRNKKHIPKVILVPRIIPMITAAEVYPDLALKFHFKLLAAIKEPAIVTFNQLSKELCVIAGAMSYASSGAPILGKRDPASLAIMSAIRVMESIVDRHTATEKTVIAQQEAKTLIAASGALDGVLCRVSRHSYDTAKNEVDSHISDQEERIAA
jgi:hypothetical protein